MILFRVDENLQKKLTSDVKAELGIQIFLTEKNQKMIMKISLD